MKSSQGYDDSPLQQQQKQLRALQEQLLQCYTPVTAQPKVEEKPLTSSWSVSSLLSPVTYIARTLSDLSTTLYAQLPSFSKWLSTTKNLTPLDINNKINERATVALKDILINIVSEDEAISIRKLDVINDLIMAVRKCIETDAQAAKDASLLSETNDVNHHAIVDEYEKAAYCLFALKNAHDLAIKVAVSEAALNQETAESYERAKAAVAKQMKEIESLKMIKLSKPEINSEILEHAGHTIDDAHALYQSVEPCQDDKSKLEGDIELLIKDIPRIDDAETLAEYISELQGCIDTLVPAHNDAAQKIIALREEHIKALEEAEALVTTSQSDTSEMLEKNLDVFSEPVALQEFNQSIVNTERLIREAEVSHATLCDTIDALLSEPALNITTENSPIKEVMNQIHGISLSFNTEMVDPEKSNRIADYKCVHGAWIKHLKAEKDTDTAPTCLDILAQKEALMRIDMNDLLIRQSVRDEARLALQDAEKRLRIIEARDKEIDDEATRAALLRQEIVARESHSDDELSTDMRIKPEEAVPTIQPERRPEPRPSLLQRHKWKAALSVCAAVVAGVATTLTLLGLIPLAVASWSLALKILFAAGVIGGAGLAGGGIGAAPDYYNAHNRKPKKTVEEAPKNTKTYPIGFSPARLFCCHSKKQSTKPTHTPRL